MMASQPLKTMISRLPSCKRMTSQPQETNVNVTVGHFLPVFGTQMIIFSSARPGDEEDYESQC